MTRVVVGPFGRVEGELELTLDIADGHVAAAHVAVPLYRGFEQILVGRPAADALVIAPRICGICSVSQSVAAAAALASLQGLVPPPNGALATCIAHAAENLADHLTHFYLFFMPDFARDTYAAQPWFPAVAQRFRAQQGSAAAEVLPVRRRLLEVMGILAGKWPHSLAFQPGGTTRAIDLGEKMRLLAIIREVRAWLERGLLGMAAEALLALADADALDAIAWRGGDLAVFVGLAQALGLERLGPGSGQLMSFGAYPAAGPALFAAGTCMGSGKVSPVASGRIVEDSSHAFLQGGVAHPAAAETIPDLDRPGAYSFARAPRLDGAPVEVGALARQAVDGQPLVRSLLARTGRSSVASRVVARSVECARLVMAMEHWVRALRPREAFCHATPLAADGAGTGLVEAARGSLGHWLTVRDGRIARYQIVAPTTWNFSPRDASGMPGPLEQALVGTRVDGDGAGSVAIQHVVRSFDPCMVCTAH